MIERRKLRLSGVPRRAISKIGVAIMANCIALGVAAAEPAREMMNAPPGVSGNKIERKGVAIEFSATPVSASGATGAIKAGDDVEISFRLIDAATRAPLTRRRPGAWLDVSASALASDNASCKEKVQSYLKGAAGVRPSIDLTSYYIFAFNSDPSISVIDPLVGIAGRTNLLATIPLDAPAGDWTKSRDDARLYVTMPAANQVAVVDAGAFKVARKIYAGEKPVRVALSPDGRRLWVANDSAADETGGVTIIDIDAGDVIARLPTGKGHHEIAFSERGEFAFVSNREKGDIAIIDAVKLEIVQRLATGRMPLSLVYSVLAQALYVADGVDGTITVVDGREHNVVARIGAQSGLGPITITPDGRWVLALNSKANLVHVVEIATNRLEQNIPVGPRPYQISFSESFAYIRSLDTEHIGMISLKELGGPTALQISTFAAGAKPPSATPDLGVAASVVPAVGEAAMVVASPSDNLIYYYMEGMLAPSGSFPNPAHAVSAVGVVDRSLRETAAGVYSARVKIPAAGVYDAALMLDAPQLVECFSLRIGADKAATERKAPRIDYLVAPATARAGDSVIWRFRLDDTRSNAEKDRPADVRLLLFAPGSRRIEILARAVEDNVYEAQFNLTAPGAYRVYVGAPTRKINFGALPSRGLIAYER